MKTELEKILERISAEGGRLERTAKILPVVTNATRADGEAADYRFELSFSSEEPYQRWFGKEILGHQPGEVRLDWLKAGSAPFLLQHDQNQVIGVVESVKLEDGRGTAVVRFGKSELAQEIRQDVIEGIRSNVSVGYRVHEMKLIKQNEEEGDSYRVTDWEPLEISSVALPADQTVGIGRTDTEPNRIKIKQENQKMDKLKELARKLGLSEDASIESVMEAARSAGEKSAHEQARTELTRRETIEKAAKEHGLEADAASFIREGKSAEAFNQHVLKKYAEGHSPLKQVGDFSKSEQKDLRKFSLLRALGMLRDGKQLDGIEADVMKLGVSEAGRCGIVSSEGRSIIIPSMMLRATAMSSASTEGGEFIPTATSKDVIDTLRNRMVIGRLGGKVMTGLAGTLKLPKVTTSPSGASVAENGALSDATIVTGELTLSPHRVGATLPYSNTLFMQSSPDVNAFVRDQLEKACALRADWLALNGDGTTDGHWYGILNYSGIGSVATGTDGDAPTLAHLIGLETEVAVDNADIGMLAYLTSAKGRGILKQTAKVASTDSRMLWDADNLLNGYRADVSNQVPANVTKGSATTNTTSVIFGNWDDAVLGFFGGMEVIVDPYTLAKKSQTQVTVNMFADFDLIHAQSFAAVSGIKQS